MWCLKDILWWQGPLCTMNLDRVFTLILWCHVVSPFFSSFYAAISLTSANDPTHTGLDKFLL
jgi:hypothetical protein